MTNAQIAGSILIAAVVIPTLREYAPRISDGFNDWLDDRINRMVIDGLAAMEDEDAAWDREIDEAIALTETPMFKWLASENPGAIDSLAAAEASRADRSEPMRWAK